MDKIIEIPGTTFSEYSVMTGLTPEGCNIENVNLRTRLSDNLEVKVPVISAAMGSVTGYEMCYALAKEGGMGIIPARVPADKAAGIVKRIKKEEMGFVEHPVTSLANESIDKVVEKINKYGHSKIFITDRFQRLMGIYTKEMNQSNPAPRGDEVGKHMMRFSENCKIPYVINPELSIEEANQIMKEKEWDYLVVLDDTEKRVLRVAFKKDADQLQIGAAITTHPGWKERVETLAAAGVDLISIDTSDGYSEYVKRTIEEYKNMGLNIPICGGNIITYEGALDLMKWGADIVKIGMSSGSICSTSREKAVGRAPMSALYEAFRAKLDFKERNVPIIMDGGIANSADMVVALTMADAIMLGGYLNHFYEAAGKKYDQHMNPAFIEKDIEWVLTYGEGSNFAQNLGRYDHTSIKTFFEEGVVDKVPYWGRLKPRLKNDMLKVRAALVNVGAMDLEEYREKSRLEPLSLAAYSIVKQTHDLKSNM